LILQILHSGNIVHIEPIGPEPVSVGRSSSNRIVLRDESISGHHALLFREGEEVRIRDLRSTNGTFVDGVQVRGEAPLSPGCLVRFGHQIEARLSDSAPPLCSSLRLEQLDGPLAWAVDRAIFVLPDRPKTLIRVGSTELWLVHDGAEVERIEPGIPFTVDGVRYLIREDTGVGATVRPADLALPYRLEVDLLAERATLSDGAAVARIQAANRVALLHVLGKNWLEQPAGAERGWCRDDRLATLIWGRAHRSYVRNNLNVLIHRVRDSVDQAGLDRWFIERRTGETRIRVSEVLLAS